MDDDVRTVWCGNLSEKVTEEILYELFLQGGPIQRISIPKDRDGRQRTFAFITYKHVTSVPYALSLFDGTSLFNRHITMSRRKNVELPPAQCAPEYSFDMNHMLQLGQQMLLGNDISHIRMDPFGMNMNMLPNSDFRRDQRESTHTHKDDRKSRRMHPYHREKSESSNHHEDHRSRNHHSNHRKNDYSRHNYKNNRRNYR